MLKKTVLLYLSNFVLLDIVVGVIINNLNIGGLFHPGLFIRGVILVLLVVNFLCSINNELPNSARILFYFLLTIILSVSINTLFRLDYRFLFAELINVSKPVFIILLSHYVYRHKQYFKSRIDEIFKTNYWVFTINIVFSFVTGIGISTYDNVAGSTKGFLDAGNSASILALVFLMYFLFNDKIRNTRKVLYLFLSTSVIYMIGTKVIFLIPGVLFMYLLLTLYRSQKQRWLKLTLVITPFLFLLVFIVPQLLNNLLPRYLPMLKNLNLANVGQISFYDFLVTYRRTFFAIEQSIYQFTDIRALLIGIGDVGQNEFWQGYGFKFAGMDFFDFIFQYGIIALGFLAVYISKALRFSIYNRRETALKVCLIVILLYSFFGGYVLYSLTSGTMMALLLGVNLNEA